MASIARDPGGRKRILCNRPDGKRVCIRLGKMTVRNAEAIKLKIEAIVSAGISRHAIDDETARWISRLGEALAKKLTRVGLIPEQESTTLGPFIDSYIAVRHDVKPSTTKNYKQTRASLLGFFDPETPLRDITSGAADEWRLWMLKLPLGENTVRRRCGRAKQFMKAAMRRRLISFNPFDDLKSAVRANRDLFYFMSREEARQVIDACPDAQWRLLFALSRYGGLRCPSEHLLLKWDQRAGRLTRPEGVLTLTISANAWIKNR